MIHVRSFRLVLLESAKTMIQACFPIGALETADPTDRWGV